ncbi:MAG: polar amino acid transport system ATP-binding protein, partial [Pseudonocardiales bacterium]|nr:polar amino acid transport system ATP-binding protein [Pseudonocardiales bacterium]
MSEPLVLAEGVRKSFGSVEVLCGISLKVDPGQVLCIIGPSGSGKSTFIRCVNHLEKIDGGRLLVDGHLVGYRRAGNKLHEMRESEIAKRREDVGMVFQHFNLFPHMTVMQNLIEAPTKVKGVPKQQAIEE